MSITITVNQLSLCHKGCGGTTTATLPDVCKSPYPVPYPNIAFSSDLIDGTTTIVADGGNMCANYGSQFFKSIGDEPGTLGGVASSTFIKEATWITFSFDVKFEGRAVCRLTDKMFQNHQNTVDLAGFLEQWLQGPKGPAECAALLARIMALTFGDAVTKGLITRFTQQINGAGGPNDPVDRPAGRDPGLDRQFPNGTNSWDRHDWEMQRQQNDLARSLDAYDKYCKDPPPPPEAYEYGTKPLPKPSEWVNPAPAPAPAPSSSSVPWGLIGLGAAAIVIGGAIILTGGAAAPLALAL